MEHSPGAIQESYRTTFLIRPYDQYLLNRGFTKLLMNGPVLQTGHRYEAKFTDYLRDNQFVE